MTEKSQNKKRIIGKPLFSAACAVFLGAVGNGLYRLKNWMSKGRKKFICLKSHSKNIHTVLYKCPACKAESRMESSNVNLWCNACGKHWVLEKGGRIRAWNGKTEFHSEAQWRNWERECIREEIASGKYYFEDTVRVEVVTVTGRGIRQGNGRLIQTTSQTVLEFRYYGEDYTLVRSARALEGLHIEFNPDGSGDCIELPGASERFRCYLSKRDAVVKLAYAAEEIHRQAVGRREA